MAFGSSKGKEQSGAKQNNVPLYTLEAVDIPDNCVMEYVGMIAIHTDRVGSGNDFLDKAIELFQQRANSSGADSVYGVRISTASNGIRNYIDIYGTAVKFVEQ